MINLCKQNTEWRMLCLLKLLHKALAKRRHIVADTSVSPFARTGNICCGHKFCVRDTKNVSDFVQKHFVSATNVSQFAQHGNKLFILCPARLRAQETLWATMCPQQCVLVCQHLKYKLDLHARIVHVIVTSTTSTPISLLSNILYPQQMFLSLRSPRNIMGNIVSATMCPRLPGPLIPQVHRMTVRTALS